MSDSHPPENTPQPFPSSSIDLICQSLSQIFAEILDPNTPLFKGNSAILGMAYPEFQATLATVQPEEDIFSPRILAGVEFLKGREYYDQNRIKQALSHYQRCLSLEPFPPFWLNSSPRQPENSRQEMLQCLAAVLFHVGLCYCRLGQSDSSLQNLSYWQEAKNYLKQSLDIFAQAERQDLVAKYIIQLCEALKQLEAWEELQICAQKAISLHISYGTESDLAKDYGFLAEAAMHESKWAHANQLAELAIAIQDQSLTDPLDITAKQDNYLLMLAESKQELEAWQRTVDQLEDALKRTDPQKNFQAYLQIIKALRKLYFEQDQYGQASRLKEAQLNLEYQYGLRGFIGVRQLQPRSQFSEDTETLATEIRASDRLKDVHCLMERIQSPSHKLIVLHGFSGVGKSSLLNAGLVPMLLQQRQQDAQVAMPILLRVYTDWLREADPKTWNLESVLKLLKRNEDNKIATVLIFDQFEEFFVICRSIDQRRPFYQFLRDCLSLKSVKVLLSMRTDVLHYLLECDRLIALEQVMGYEILSKQVIYGLGNFSQAQARQLIEAQSQRAHLNFETDLIEKIIKDLAIENQEISPIELQVVGSQLQSKGIATLNQYQKLGEKPKQNLLDQFLDELLKDCSEKNEQIAFQLLSSLIQEDGNRPLKTRRELAKILGIEQQKIDVVLEVLVQEGAILLLPDIPDDRYQLAHDYLVTLIRNPKGKRLIAELELQRDQAQRKLIEEKPNSFLDRAIASVLRWMRTD